MVWGIYFKNTSKKQKCFSSEWGEGYTREAWMWVDNRWNWGMLMWDFIILHSLLLGMLENFQNKKLKANTAEQRDLRKEIKLWSHRTLFLLFQDKVLCWVWYLLLHLSVKHSIMDMPECVSPITTGWTCMLFTCRFSISWWGHFFSHRLAQLIPTACQHGS